MNKLTVPSTRLARWRWLTGLAVAWLLICTMAACGGGTDVAGGVGEGGTGAPAMAASIGEVTGLDSDSITVNGQTFARPANTQILDALSNPLTDSDLKLGMWVAVEGQADSNGNAPQAASIHVYPAVSGVVNSVDDGLATITVLGTTVQRTPATLVDGTAGSNLAAGDTVEVHGLLGATDGTVIASRIDKLNALPAVALPYQLRGRVSGLSPDGTTFFIGTQAISRAKATVVLPRGLVNGMVIRVSAAKPPVPGTDWVVDHITVDWDLPPNMGFFYVEGVVDQWQAGPRFMIENLVTDASTANGKLKVTQSGQRIAAIGALRNGVLLAKSVSVIAEGSPTIFTLSGPVKNYTSLASFEIRSVVIDATHADFTVGNATHVANGAKVWVEGPIVGRTLMATKAKINAPAP
jgi:hypothetical protein